MDSHPVVKIRTGIGRYVFNLLSELGKLGSGHEIIPFYFNFKRHFKERNLWDPYPDIRPCEVKAVPGFIFHQIWKRFSLFPLEIFTGKADLFHFPNYLIKPSVSGKIVLTVHDLAFRRLPETIMPKNLWDLKKNFEKSIHASDAVITVSEFTRDEFRYFYPEYKKPVYVTYNGIDEFFGLSFPSEKVTWVRQKYGLPEEYLLYVGTIEPRKNLLMLLQALEILKKHRHGTKLVIIGQKGWLCEDFFETIERLNLKENVIMPGFVSGEDLPFIYHAAKLFIFPTLYEGFGIPPLEAMACGTPVMASAIPVMKEVLREAASYFDPLAGGADLAEQIRMLLEDSGKLRELSEKGLIHCRKYSWRDTAVKTLKAYEEIVGC